MQLRRTIPKACGRNTMPTTESCPSNHIKQQHHDRHGRSSSTSSKSSSCRNLSANAEMSCNSQVHSTRQKCNGNRHCSSKNNTGKTQDNMLTTTDISSNGWCCCNASANPKCNATNTNKNNKNNNNTFNCSNLHSLAKFAVILLLFSWCGLAQAALRNVNLFIEPPAVRRGQSVTLYCQYSLEGAPLYSVKFYRGQLEFFRYTPGEYPNTKVFHYPGIKVDESASNATQVVIRNVSFGLSGNFSCEVTADAPLFSTATAYAQMQVVEFPEKRPQLFTEHLRYEPGDVLRANCSTLPSRPRAELRFSINSMPVSSGETQYIRTVDNLIASRLSLKLQLQGVHFAGGSNSHTINGLGNGGALGGGGGNAGAPTGGLLLRCTAQIGDLYQEYKEIELGTPQKDPVPARVTLSSSSGLKNFFETYFTSAAAATKPFNCSGHYAHLLAALCTAATAALALQWLQRCSCS